MGKGGGHGILLCVFFSEPKEAAKIENCRRAEACQVLHDIYHFANPVPSISPNFAEGMTYNRNSYFGLHGLESGVMQLFLFFALSSLLARALLVATQPQANWYLLAVLSDLAMALPLGCLGLWLLGWRRYALLILLAAYCLFMVANLESIAALGKGVDLRDIGYIADPAFLRASTSHFNYPWFTLALLVSAAWVGWRQLRTSMPAPILAGLAITGLALLAVNPSSQWQRQQLLVPSVVRALDSSTPLEPGQHGAAPGLTRDLEGESMLSIGRARNVVLLVLEGIGAQAMRDDMPQLRKLAASGSSAQTLYAHSNQTIRGLYAMLCGDYSKLSLDTTKAAEYLQLEASERPLCLPGALAGEGFHTSYLQAAPLAYMGKDRFMPAVGFAEVLGEESFPERYADVGWGPDDKAFLEQAAGKIAELHTQSQPFFTTLLTVGTHHPYTLPPERRGEQPKLDARRYLDAALAEFWQTLEAKGVWQDTLLIVTADESHGDNLGLWLARGSGVPALESPGIFGLLDIPLSVLDYLGLAEENPSFGGRSLFRQYSGSRPLLYFGDYLYAFNQSGQRLYCESGSRCYRDGKLVSGGEATSQLQALQQWRQQADASLRISQTGTTTTLLKNQDFAVASGRLNILSAGKYVRLRAGESFQLSLKLSYRGSGQLGLRPAVVDSGDETPLVDMPTLPTLRNGDQLVWRQNFQPLRDIDAAQLILLGQPRRGVGVAQVELFELQQGPAQPSTELLRASTSIGHAGGRWQSIDYSNSIEALRGNGERFPIMELDLSLTRDGRLVCLHDWGLGYTALFKRKLESPASFAEFRQAVAEQELPFTPCDEKTLPVILEEQPALRLVIDSWSDTAAVMQRLLEVIPGATQRILPQAYQPGEIADFRQLGFEKIIWTLYRYDQRQQLGTVLEQLEQHRPWAVAMPADLASAKSIKSLLPSGSLVYVHTVNDCPTAQRLWQQGASIYSDSLQNGDCPPAAHGAE
jgi:hypothetical protein